MFGLIPRRKEARPERALAPRAAAPWTLMEEFAPVFERFFGRLPAPFLPVWEEPVAWGVEVEDKGLEYLVRIEMPGFEAPEIEVLLTGEYLTIKAEHKLPPAGEEKKEVIERRLERTVLLPTGMDAEKIESMYRNGVLELRLPKKPEMVARRLDVKT